MQLVQEMRTKIEKEMEGKEMQKRKKRKEKKEN
jgi:hypothetical protein